MEQEYSERIFIEVNGENIGLNKLDEEMKEASNKKKRKKNEGKKVEITEDK